MIAYLYQAKGSANGTATERLRTSGRADASTTQQRVVFVFEVVVAAVILIQSPASWPVKIAVFAGLQVVMLGFLAGVRSFYEDD